MNKKSLITLLGLLLFFVLCLVPSGYSQQGTQISQTPGTPWQLGLSWTFTASSSSTADFNVKGLSYWRVIYVPSGSVSGCTLSVDSSATGLSFVTGGIIASASIGNCTAAGQYITTTGTTPTNFGQITPTITGTGTVTVVLFGYTDNPAAAGGSAATITSPTDGSGYVEVNCKTGCAAGTPGQQVMANSQPVVIASNQSAVSVSQSGTWNVGQNGTWTVQPGNTANTTPWLITVATALPAGTNTIGQVNTQPAGFASLVGFQQAVTATATALSSNAAHGFCVKALSTNSLTVYVGPSGVTTSTGYPLAAGDSICYQASNTNLAYVIASTTGASVAVSGN